MVRKLLRLGVAVGVVALMTMSAAPSANAAIGDSVVAVVQGRVDGGGVTVVPALSCSTFTGAILTGSFNSGASVYAGNVGLTGGNITACEFGNTAFGIGLEHPPAGAIPAGGILPDTFLGNASAAGGTCVGGGIEGDYVRAGVIAVALVDVNYRVGGAGTCTAAPSAVSDVEAVAVIAAIPGGHPAAPGDPSVTFAAGPVIGTDLPVGWEPPL
jgi:hypothetical protein